MSMCSQGYAHVPVKRKRMQLASIRPFWPWIDDHGVIYAYCAISKEGDNDIWTESK